MKILKVFLENSLFNPETIYQKSFFFIIIFLIFFSSLLLLLFVEFPRISNEFANIFLWIEIFISFIFTGEIFTRIYFRPNPKDYLLTWYGLVDILCTLPIWIIIFTDLNTELIKIIICFRSIRTLRFIYYARNFKGLAFISVQIIPFVIVSFSIKTILIYFNYEGISQLGFFISVIGFLIGVLLSTKLGIAMTRMYLLEDKISEFLGSIESAIYYSKDKDTLHQWVQLLYMVIKTGEHRQQFITLSDKIIKIHKDYVPGPTWTTVQTSAWFIFHKIKTKTPSLYTSMLQQIIIIYAVCMIVFIPGFSGLVLSLLIAYIFSGIFFIIRYIDEPYAKSKSLIKLDLSTYEEYLEAHKNRIQT